MYSLKGVHQEVVGLILESYTTGLNPGPMGCHVSACPNEQVGRTTPLEFRAHVAMMGGSFGFELAMEHMSEQERAAVPGLIKFSEKINPIIISGDLYRLALPIESNIPAALYLDQSGDVGVLFVFRISTVLRTDVPGVKLQGLKAEANYRVDGAVYSGAQLMNVGMKFKWAIKDYQSKVCIVERVY
jgi:alpha-galactosidase